MSSENSPVLPRAFISYSWSSPTHEMWVLRLATRLREDGVDIVLDKWDLKPGHDSNVFMESMVTDPSVGKVIMICDKVYVEKANARQGGVGIESQIISPELYGKSSQDKFAAVITEDDVEGKACIPVFYGGRIFFDFRYGEKEESYEQLLRWLVDRPLHVKPKIGRLPEAILQAAPVASGTQSKAKRAEAAIKERSGSAPALVVDYGEALIAELNALSPDIRDGEPSDEAVLEALAQMRPYLRQFIDVAAAIVRFSEGSESWAKLIELFEKLASLMYRSPDVMTWHPHQYDSYKIFTHDAFVSAIALALDEGRMELAESALDHRYLVRTLNGSGRRPTSDYLIFNEYIESLSQRNQRLKLGRISLLGDLMKEFFSEESLVSFDSISQADFVLHVASFTRNLGYKWFGHSLVYSTNRYDAFQIFARAESEKYFTRIKRIFSLDSIEQFKEKIAEISKDRSFGRAMDYNRLPYEYMANMEFLGVEK